MEQCTVLQTATEILHSQWHAKKFLKQTISCVKYFWYRFENKHLKDPKHFLQHKKLLLHFDGMFCNWVKGLFSGFTFYAFIQALCPDMHIPCIWSFHTFYCLSVNVLFK